MIFYLLCRIVVESTLLNHKQYIINLMKSQKLVSFDDLTELSPWGYEDKSINLQQFSKVKIKKQHKANKNKVKPKIKLTGNSQKLIRGTRSIQKISSLPYKDKNILKTIEYQLPPLSMKKGTQQKQKNVVLTDHSMLVAASNNKINKQKSNKKLVSYSISTIITEKKMSKFRLHGQKFNPSERTITNRWIDRQQLNNIYQINQKSKHIPANTIMIHKRQDDVLRKVLGQLHGKFY